MVAAAYQYDQMKFKKYELPDHISSVEETVSIQPDETVTISCPDCDCVKVLNAYKYYRMNGQVTITSWCECGYAHTVRLDRRKFERKSIKAKGFCIVKSTSEKDRITVSDISKSGMKLKIGKSGSIKIGQILTVMFHLPNCGRKLFKTEVIIKNLTGIYAGTEFIPENN
ncbi:PilZ domain-containing protein [Desulfobacterales bacterium HSG16]|nr:PilZ domain-containing protein [Desulfobacterales bacterium HSG16]